MKHVKSVIVDGQKLGSVVWQDDAYYALARFGKRIHALRNQHGRLRSFPSEDIAEQAVRENALASVETGEKL